MAGSFVSYAQNGEDIVISRVFSDLEQPGFYVDVGAGDPIGYSATYALYERGWSGINVEPVPEFAAALRAIRSRDITAQVAVGDRSGSIAMHVAAGTGLSTAIETEARKVEALGYASETIEVPVVLLDDLLDEFCDSAQSIHVLKIDVEGMEAEVLAGITLTRWRPWMCVVEATEPLSQRLTYERWEDALIDAGYRFHLFDGLNRFYLADERSDLAPRLSYGPCVFDQPYQRADVSLAIERHRGAVDRALADTRAELAEAHARLADLDASIEQGNLDRSATAERIRSVEEELSACRADLAAAEATQTDLRHRLAEADRERGATIGERDELRHELQMERDRSAELARAIERALTSMSWKVTRPLRAVRSLLGGARSDR